MTAEVSNFAIEGLNIELIKYGRKQVYYQKKILLGFLDLFNKRHITCNFLRMKYNHIRFLGENSTQCNLFMRN